MLNNKDNRLDEEIKKEILHPEGGKVFPHSSRREKTDTNNFKGMVQQTMCRRSLARVMLTRLRS